mgnify:CR=1 FL=1
MHSLPRDLIEGVEAALEARVGRPTRVVNTAPVGGGCIHNATRLELEEGDVAFVKWGARKNVEAGGFRAEAAGLDALAAAAALRVPEVFGVFDP